LCRRCLPKIDSLFPRRAHSRTRVAVYSRAPAASISEPRAFGSRLTVSSHLCNSCYFSLPSSLLSFPYFCSPFAPPLPFHHHGFFASFFSISVTLRRFWIPVSVLGRGICLVEFSGPCPPPHFFRQCFPHFFQVCFATQGRTGNGSRLLDFRPHLHSRHGFLFFFRSSKRFLPPEYSMGHNFFSVRCSAGLASTMKLPR